LQFLFPCIKHQNNYYYFFFFFCCRIILFPLQHDKEQLLLSLNIEVADLSISHNNLAIELYINRLKIYNLAKMSYYGGNYMTRIKK